MATSNIRIQQCALVELCPHPDGQHCDSESTDAEHSRLADWLISTGSGVGLLSGSFLTTPLANRLTGGRTVQVSFIIILVGCALQPFTQNTYLLAGCMAIMNLMVVPANSVLVPTRR